MAFQSFPFLEINFFIFVSFKFIFFFGSLYSSKKFYLQTRFLGLSVVFFSTVKFLHLCIRPKFIFFFGQNYLCFLRCSSFSVDILNIVFCCCLFDFFCRYKNNLLSIGLFYSARARITFPPKCNSQSVSRWARTLYGRARPRSYVVSMKNQLDGLPFFLNYGAPLARAELRY